MTILCLLLCLLLSISPSDGNLKQALKEASGSLDRAMAANDTTGIIKSLCIQAGIAIDLGQDDMAVDCYNKCIDYCGFGEPMFMLSSSLFNIANIYYQNGEYDKAAEYIHRSIHIDSRRASDSVLALRYLLAAQIMHDKGDYRKAIELTHIGAELAKGKSNNNLTGRFKFIETLCLEDAGGETPDWTTLETGYREALDFLKKSNSSHHYGVVNPYEGEVLYHLGLAVSAQGKDGKPYLGEAIKLARTSQKMRGLNPMVEYESCRALSGILREEGNAIEAEKYSSEAESLSFIPYVKSMSAKLSLSQMEFIRRERDRAIAFQKGKLLFILLLAIILASGLVVILLQYKELLIQKQTIEEKNGQLVRLLLEKDKLIKMTNETIPLPEIKLSSRELQILDLLCKGKASKEMADLLNISVRTVENHKSNIFKKTGINKTAELIAFSYMYGLGKAGR